MRALPFCVLLLLSSISMGCASGNRSSDTGVVRDSNRISQEEIQGLPSGTAFDAVQRLRPIWLRSRSTTIGSGARGTVSLPRVFVDERDFGTHGTLREFFLDQVEEILYLSASDATTRYGTGYPGGIRHIRLKKGLS